jgi:hypothetical protein
VAGRPRFFGGNRGFSKPWKAGFDRCRRFLGLGCDLSRTSKAWHPRRLGHRTSRRGDLPRSSTRAQRRRPSPRAAPPVGAGGSASRYIRESAWT